MDTNKYTHIAGIDISKSKIDLTLIDTNHQVTLYHRFENDDTGFEEMCTLIEKNNISLSNVLFCAEKTGLYSVCLGKYLYTRKLDLWLQDGLKISDGHHGPKRGKNDKKDSERIARYACRYMDEVVLFEPQDETIEKMNHVYKLRDRLVIIIGMLKVALSESKGILDPKLQKILEVICKLPITYLEKAKKDADAKLLELINEDEKIKKMYERVSSVRGVGKQTAMYLLIVTNGFKRIRTARKASCYGGMAPFEYSSGTSVRGKTRISNYGDKKLKRLLHLGALSIIGHKKGEEYEYYCRKEAEGKPRMKIINAIRNKILGRVYACIREERTYVEKLERVA